MKKRFIQWMFMPFRFKFLRHEYEHQAINVLDVGCGNHSPSLTKRYFPAWNYSGLDREEYIIDAGDKKAMTKYYALDLSTDELASIPEHYYDVVIMAHVLEHLRNGLVVIRLLTQKIKPGGKFYIEFPSERSLTLPSVYGTLNFCDDRTHVRVYGIAEIANVLLENNFKILRAGTRRDKIMILLLPLKLLLKFILRKKIRGSDLWDVTGFASYVYAEKCEIFS
ncbi:MAG TPA: methyltransferase domain-containing protein [Bacteroidota bacterium]|nr:methyltransferase domain-containing protein [Bacteroidota bacterium]